MRFHASLADSCIGTRIRWGIDQGREMLRNGCGKVNRATTRVTALLTARKASSRHDGRMLSRWTRGGGVASARRYRDVLRAESALECPGREREGCRTNPDAHRPSWALTRSSTLLCLATRQGRHRRMSDLSIISLTTEG